VRQIEEAASNLIKFGNKVDAEKMNQASFLMVLTGRQFAYRRADGLLVVPGGYFRIPVTNTIKNGRIRFIIFFFRFCTRSRTVFRTFYEGFGITLQVRILPKCGMK